MSAFWSAVKAGSKTKIGQKIISALTGGKQKTTGTEVIKKFSPLKKFKGQKSVQDIKLKTSSKKFQMAVENFKEKTKEAYSKTKKTKTKHYYAPKDFLK